MPFNKRILIALEGGPHCADALKRADLIAGKTGAEIELLWFGSAAPWCGFEAEITQLSSRFSVEKIVSEGGLLPSIKKAWKSDRFALLIKGCDLQHSKPSLLAPIDWQLLRETPCPVLLVKQPDPWASGSILAAVNPLSNKAHQLQHDQSVLKVADLIARGAGAELKVVVATPPPMQAAEADAQSPQRIDEKARTASAQLLNELDMDAGTLCIGEGPAEYWIAQVAAEQKASLVVISTRARGGIKGALLGNTAEQIMDRLDADLMVLRPGLAEQLPSDW